MKQLYPLLALLCLNFSVFSQCADCTINEDCTTEDLFPAVCPEFMPDATAGEEYEDYLTFFMPAEVNDPNTGIQATLLEVVITNVQGLPFGMDFTMNNADQTYYPNAGETLGCATICGTPLLAGFYEVQITAHVTAEAFGISTELDQVFVSPFTVLPGSISNASFTYDNLAGCGSLDVNFEGLINGDPNPTTWEWDFGNGNTSDEQFPPTQTFTGIGEQVVTLETTIWDYVLNDLALTSIGDGWGGDIDESFGLLNPDPYFTVTNGSGNVVYTSSSNDGSMTGTWTDIGLILDNPPYTLSVWDSDAITSDDFLGSLSMESTDGSFVFSEGGNAGTLSISLDPGDVFNDEEVVTLFEEPNPEFTVDEDNNLLFYDDQTLETFTWFFDGDTIPNAVDSVHMMGSAGGIFECLVTNIYGCEAWSSPYTHCPEFTPVLDDETGMLSAPEGFESYQWYYNGLEIDGATSSQVLADDYGNYAVEITTDYGCETLSEVFIFTGVEGIPQLEVFNIYPNPSDGLVTLDLAASRNLRIKAELISMQGKTVWKDRFQIQYPQKFDLNLSDLEAGVYLFRVSSGRGSNQMSLVIR